jgi:hypothetical protein
MRKLTAVHIEAFEAELQREGYVKGGTVEALIRHRTAQAAAKGVDAWLRTELAKPVGGNSVAIGAGGSVDPKLTH